VSVRALSSLTAGRWSESFPMWRSARTIAVQASRPHWYAAASSGRCRLPGDSIASPAGRTLSQLLEDRTSVRSAKMPGAGDLLTWGPHGAGDGGAEAGRRAHRTAPAPSLGVWVRPNVQHRRQPCGDLPVCHNPALVSLHTGFDRSPFARNRASSAGGQPVKTTVTRY
jgi:hypothetical protein